MGGSSNSTIQQLQGLFGQNTGYQQPNQVAPISAPQYPAALTPSPEQAAAATVARMQARTPPVMAAPVTAPKKAPISRGQTGSGNGPGGLGGRGM